jgi:hypothetical protein
VVYELIRLQFTSPSRILLSGMPRLHFLSCRYPMFSLTLKGSR